MSDRDHRDQADRPADGTEPPAPRVPPGFPEPPDPARLAAMRRQLDDDLRRRRSERTDSRRRWGGRLDGRQFDAVGRYTLIPALLLAGPAVGYILGRLVEGRIGGEPWPVVGGTLFGLAAAFRQIFLILADRTAPPPRGPRDGGERPADADETGPRQ